MPKAKHKLIPENVAARTIATQPPQPAKAASRKTRKEKGERSTKQTRVLSMLRTSAGATIAAVMKVTGWQQHSVRGFFAGVVRKKLRLKLSSKKIDGNRIYRIMSASGARSSARQPTIRTEARLGLVSIGAERSQDGQRNVEFVRDSRRLISQSNITMKPLSISGLLLCRDPAPSAFVHSIPLGGELNL